MSDLRQLREQVNAAHRAYHTLHDALVALPNTHPAYQELTELVALAAKYWHDTRLTLDAAKAESRTSKEVRE